MNHPHCGHCGYDLTGAEGNRCPECGLLFIVAGVLLRPKTRSNSWRAIRRGILFAIVGAIGISAVVSWTAYRRARAARDRAVAQQQAALARQTSILAEERAALETKSPDEVVLPLIVGQGGDPHNPLMYPPTGFDGRIQYDRADWNRDLSPTRGNFGDIRDTYPLNTVPNP